MPKLVAALPKYRRHKASGQAVVTIAGKDHYLGPWQSAASKAEYDRLISEWLASGRPSTRPTPEREYMVSELILAFAKFAKGYYVKNGRATGTAENFRRPLSMLRKLYGRTPARSFGPLALKAIRQKMIEAGHSRRYINDNIERIKQVFQWGVSEELVPADVFHALQAVKGLRKGRSEARETAPVEPVDDEVVEATLPYLPPVVADMIRLQRLTGARPGEICSLRPVDVDRSGEVWKYTPAEHKTEHHGRQRVIPIGPRAQAILLPYLLRDANAFCFSPKESEQKRRAARHAQRKTPIRYGNRPGTNRKRRPARPPQDCYTNDSYRRAIHRACDLAFPPPEDLPQEQHAQWRSQHRWSPNRLRHTAATEIRRRFGLEAAQVTLGHSSADVTQIYAERDWALAERVIREVG